ncbi:MAG: HPr family phosphocarrier protein [Microbacteriaceae bacterium]
MPSQITKIVSPVGLHARPAAQFVALAKEAETVKVGRPGVPGVNGKSIAMVLTLGIGHDEEIEVNVEGENAEEHLSKLIALLETAE